MPEKSVGKPITRVDGRAKVTGAAQYSGEQDIPRVAQAVLIMSTIPHGRVASMDTKAALAAPGVLAVLTPFNTEKLPAKPKEAGQNRPTSRVLTALQDPLVHYANQPIGCVVAETLEQAQEGAALVKVQYVEQPFVLDFARSLSSAYKPKKAGSQDDPDYSRGDVAAELAKPSLVKIDHLYTTPFETHNPMEPHATLAVWDGPDKLTLYDATQGVFTDRETVASLMGLKPDNVKVITPYIGGGFGSKGPTWSHVPIAALAAKAVQRPVKLVLTRPQMFNDLGFRSRTRQTIQAAAQPDGTMTALKHDTVAQTSDFDEFMEAASLSARMLYNNPNDSTTHRLVKANIGTPSFMRAPGEAPGTYGLEAAMDEMAYALKMDPIAFRLKNYADQDLEKNHPWSSKSLRQCYEQGAQRFGWAKRQMAPRSMRDGRLLVGMGMATAVYPTRRSAANARARLMPDGTAVFESATQDIGTGTYTIMTQISADSIGLPLDKVTVHIGMSDFPEAPVSGGSQTAASAGSAFKGAGEALREKVIQLATSDKNGPLYHASALDIVMEDGRISVRGNPSRGEALTELLARNGGQPVTAEANSKPGDEKERFSMYAFGAQFAEVHVDPDLGMVKLARMGGCFAAGHILNSKTARSQFMGGMVWGIGLALEENTVFDEKRGRIVNNNLAEYHVPVNADVPPLDVSWVDEDDPYVNPLGVKGVGEIGITGAGAAIANAVYHATGKRVRDLPITVDKILS